jgi:hypothetical protein
MIDEVSSGGWQGWPPTAARCCPDREASSNCAATAHARAGRDHLRVSAAAAVNTLRAITDRSDAARAV